MLLPLKRRVVGGAAAVLLAVIIFGPMAIVTIIGRPLAVECDGLEPDACEELWHSYASGMERTGFASGPVTSVKISGAVMEDTLLESCPDVSIDRWWMFGIFGVTVIRDC